MAAAADSDRTAAISAVFSVVSTIENVKQKHGAALKELQTRLQSIFKARTGLIPSVSDAWRTIASAVCPPIVVDLAGMCPLVHTLLIGITHIFGLLRTNLNSIDIRDLHGLPVTPEIEEAIRACRATPSGTGPVEALEVLLAHEISRAVGVPLTEDELDYAATKCARKTA